MTKSRAEARKRRMRRVEGAERIVWLDRVWSFVTQPGVVGALLVVAGLLLMLSPTRAIPAVPSDAWFVTALRAPDAIQAAATILGIAAVLAAAMAWARLERVRTYAPRGLKHYVPWLGATLMGLGLAAGSFTWFLAQAELPTSRVSLPPNRSVESFPAIEAGRSFRVMLPLRAQVSSIDAEAQRATLEFFKVGEEEGVSHVVQVGEPVEVPGYRFALLGVEFDPQFKRVIIGSRAEDTIEAGGVVGDKVKFRLDGPEYEIKQIVPDYLGIMGPAAQLEDPNGASFWVFQRGQNTEAEISRGLRIVRMESAPVAVFAISARGVSEFAPAPGFVFVLGMALFLLVTDRLVGRREDEEMLDSLNELGPVRERAQEDGDD